MFHSSWRRPARVVTSTVVCLAFLVGARIGPAAAQSVSGAQLLQQARPAAPKRPDRSMPEVKIERPAAAGTTGGPSFRVRRIRIVGATLVPASDLRAIVAPSEGKTLTLAQLQRLADRISALYAQKGYPFTQAYIPVQTVRDGVVRLGVLEAHYDSIALRNSSPVRERVLRAAVSGLRPGAPVAQASLDRALLLASDVPGTEVRGVLRPGSTTGTSQLLVEVTPGPIGQSSVEVDDYGNAATGRERLGGTVSVFNPLRLGDILSVSGLTARRGMNYGSLAYALPLYGPATELQAGYSRLAYRIVNGSERHLDALGAASIADLGLQQVLVRSTTVNIKAYLSYNHTRLGDEIDLGGIHTDRHTEDWHGGATAQIRDDFGVSQLGVDLTLGRVIFDDATASVVDASSARTRGGFTKYVLSASRLQALTTRTFLYLGLQYQGADKNLDVSEQMFVGGPQSVRGYDNGIASGSQGHSETLELRRELTLQAYGRWQASAFLDHAQIQLQARRYSAGENVADFTAAGLGLSWSDAHGWAVNSALATRIGGAPRIVGHPGSVRFWMTVQKAF